MSDARRTAGVRCLPGDHTPRLDQRPLSVLQRRLTLSDMLDTSTFTELVKGFVELYKLGIKVFDEKGNKLADIKSRQRRLLRLRLLLPRGEALLHADRGPGEGRAARDDPERARADGAAGHRAPTA